MDDVALPLDISPPIGEALPLDALEDDIGALIIVNAKPDAFVVSEIELGEIALQVLLADVLIDTDDAALDDAEIVLEALSD